MAVRFSLGGPTIESRPKKTRQGKSVNTILAPTSRNKRKKKYRGQGRCCLLYTSDAADE